MVRNTETAFVPNLRGGDGTIEIRHILNKDELMGHASMYAHVIIPANAKHKEAAEMFINYLCETSVGLANCDFIGYSTPLTAVWEELDDDLKYSEIAYPSQEVLDKAEVFNTLPDDINAAMDAQWSEMKSYEEGGSGWMVVVLLLLAIAISAFNIWRKLRKKSRDNY